jgi:hypothetical protein
LSSVEIAAWIQAAATVVLVAVTARYVYLTGRLVKHSAEPPWLEASIREDYTMSGTMPVMSRQVMF